MRQMILTLQKLPYVAFVLLLLTLAFFGSLGYARDLPRGFDWQVVTGALLVACLIYQWTLFVKRVTRDNHNIRQHQKLHRWIGVLATLLFALHALRFGHVWMTGLSAVFFLTALTGIFNREVLQYRQNWIYLVWLMCHIGLSAMLMPLIAVHVWVALAYQ